MEGGSDKVESRDPDGWGWPPREERREPRGDGDEAGWPVAIFDPAAIFESKEPSSSLTLLGPVG